MSHFESTGVFTPNKNADIVRRREAAYSILAMHLFFLQVIPNSAMERRSKQNLELLLVELKERYVNPIYSFHQLGERSYYLN